MTEQTDTEKNVKSASKKKHLVLDEYGAEYILTGELKAGGQGVVWTTNHHNTLVKTSNQKDRQKRKRWGDHIRWILRQDLEGFSIASPKALITKPVPGYVMELMDGLHALEKDMQRNLDALSNGEGLQGFLNTGGLRRRLLLLSELAGTLANLHGKGLAYGDLSPSNVYVSESIGDSRLWLIDCDNICTNERAGWEHLYTPGYGAPEVVRGESGVNSLTDAWSFAVIAYQLLTSNHPLIGELVDEGGDFDGIEDFDDLSPEELQDKAFSGEIPWICDPEDDRNAAEGGIPMRMVASPQMQTLFHRTFEQGRNSAWDRPTMAEWRSAIDEAVALTMDCHNSECRSTFIRSKNCPFCKSEASIDNHLLMTALVYTDDPELDRSLLKTGYGRVVNMDETIMFKRTPAGTPVHHDSEEVFQVRLTHEGMALKVVPGQQITIKADDNAREITQGFMLPQHKKQRRKYFIHLTTDTSPDDVVTHPVWAFIW